MWVRGCWRSSSSWFVAQVSLPLSSDAALIGCAAVDTVCGRGLLTCWLKQMF